MIFFRREVGLTPQFVPPYSKEQPIPLDLILSLNICFTLALLTENNQGAPHLTSSGACASWGVVLCGVFMYAFFCANELCFVCVPERTFESTIPNAPLTHQSESSKKVKQGATFYQSAATFFSNGAKTLLFDDVFMCSCADVCSFYDNELNGLKCVIVD